MTRDELIAYRDAGVVTFKQFQVLELRLRGFGRDTIAAALDLSREAVRDRDKAGIRRIRLYEQRRKGSDADDYAAAEAC